MKRLLTLCILALVATINICSAQGGDNEIRFKDWGEKEWLDNDYIRELRNFFNAYYNGEIYDEQYEDLAPYKSLMKSKFAVLNIVPYPAGGAFIGVVFLDNPRIVFEAWVYSFVVGDVKGAIDGYEVRHCERYEKEINLTKETIFRSIKENPLNKLW